LLRHHGLVHSTERSIVTRIYRLIWNAVLQVRAAAAKQTHARGYANDLHLTQQRGPLALLRQRWRLTLSSILEVLPLLMFAQKPISVLIAENDPELLLKFAAAIGRDKGLSLIAAVSSGTAAMAFAEQNPPDVLLLDMALTDMPAVDVVRQLAWTSHGTALVVLTHFGDDAQLQACIEAGASGYFFKDIPDDGIGAGIRRLHVGDVSIKTGMAGRAPTILSFAAPSTRSEWQRHP
jgi:CheY-like chemotaxis protein